MNDLTVSDEDMELEVNHAAVKQHWRAVGAGNLDAELKIYHEDAELEYPQSGEFVRGREAIRASLAAQPDRGRIETSRILGADDLWISELILIKDDRQTNVVSIMEFRDGRVFHESQYFADPFEPPQWRAQWAGQGRRTQG